MCCSQLHFPCCRWSWHNPILISPQSAPSAVDNADNISVIGKGFSFDFTLKNLKSSMKRKVGKKGGGRGRSLTLTFTSIQPFLQQHWTCRERQRGEKQTGQGCAEGAQCYYHWGCHIAVFPPEATRGCANCTRKRECFPIHWRVLAKRSGRGRRSLHTFRSTSSWTQRSDKTSSAFDPRSCVRRAMVRVWLLLNYPERTADAQNAALWQLSRRSLPEDCTIRALSLSKMSSQAKVKKDKEIIAEYETQVKGW